MIPPRKTAQSDLFGHSPTPPPRKASLAPLPTPEPPKDTIACSQCQAKNFEARYTGTSQGYHFFMCYSGAKVIIADLPGGPVPKPGDVALFRLGHMGVEFVHIVKTL